MADTDELWISAPDDEPKLVRSDERVTCSVEWGGWMWSAEGSDRSRAADRLGTRLIKLDPFTGMDTGWGDPGHRVSDELDGRIPAGVRDMMQRHGEFTERLSSEERRFLQGRRDS